MSEYFDIKSKLVNLEKIKEDFIPDNFRVSCQRDDLSVFFNISTNSEIGAIKSTGVYLSWLEINYTNLSHADLLELEFSIAVKLLES